MTPDQTARLSSRIDKLERELKAMRLLFVVAAQREGDALAWRTVITDAARSVEGTETGDGFAALLNQLEREILIRRI